MNQSKIAKAADIKPTNLSALLNGKRNVGPATAKKIAKYLGRPDKWRNFVLIGHEELRHILIKNDNNTPPTQRQETGVNLEGGPQ